MSPGTSRIVRWAGLALAVATPVAGGLLFLLPPRALGMTPATLWRIKLALLLALEAVYTSLAAAALAATPLLGLLVVRARRRKRPRPVLARASLLSGAILVGVVLAESSAALLRGPLERAGVLALGLDTPRGPAEPTVELPGAPTDIMLRTRFPAPKDDALNLVVVGESSAEGVPFNLRALSLGSLVGWQLEKVLPGRTVRHTILAASGETLERQHRKLATLSRRPDAVIVYCGHNEFSSRLPWSRTPDYYVDARTPSRWAGVVARVERLSPFCGLIRRAADACRIAIPPPRGGNRSVVDSPAYMRDEYDRLLADFRRHLERIVAYTEEIGALPILVVPPANDAGFSPNRSFLPPQTNRAGREAFERRFRALRRLEATDATGAIEGYRSLLAEQPGFAEAHFRLARLLERAAEWDLAYRHDVAARDADGMPMRCPTPFQDAYREVAARHPGALLIDGQADFHAIGRHGLLGEDLFVDAMHPSLRGQIALAQAVLNGLKARGAFGWPEATPAPILDPAIVAAHFGLGPEAWEKFCHWGATVYDLLASGSQDPSERLARRDAYLEAARRIARGVAPEAVGLPNIGTPAAVPPAGESRVPPASDLKSPGPGGHDEGARP